MPWCLVRVKEWWFHKIPVMLIAFLLFVAGQPITLHVALTAISLILIVSSVANYGYAINELYDRDEDARAGRSNVAEARGDGPLWGVVSLSALVALGLSYLTAGMPAVILTMAALCLPAAYSMPPVRLKERLWFGALADALAAHVYPIALVILVLTLVLDVPIRSSEIIAAVGWSFMAGMRGILSHQLDTELRDRRSGLRTVVRDVGKIFVTRLVLGVIFPTELAAFFAFVILARPGVVFLAVLALYAMYELCRLLKNLRHIAWGPDALYSFPMLDNLLYEVWTPLALLLSLMLRDLRYAIVLPAYILLFWPRFQQEWKSISSLASVFRPTPETEIIAQIGLLRERGGVDLDWYWTKYPEIAKTGMDPVEHYCRVGWRQHRDPSPQFSTIRYLTSYPDVRQKNYNPLIHYILFGKQEGRRSHSSRIVIGPSQSISQRLRQNR